MDDNTADIVARAEAAIQQHLALTSSYDDNDGDDLMDAEEEDDGDYDAFDEDDDGFATHRSEDNDDASPFAALTRKGSHEARDASAKSFLSSFLNKGDDKGDATSQYGSGNHRDFNNDVSQQQRTTTTKQKTGGYHWPAARPDTDADTDTDTSIRGTLNTASTRPYSMQGGPRPPSTRVSDPSKRRTRPNTTTAASTTTNDNTKSRYTLANQRTSQRPRTSQPHTTTTTTSPSRYANAHGPSKQRPATSNTTNTNTNTNNNSSRSRRPLTSGAGRHRPATSGVTVSTSSSTAALGPSFSRGDALLEAVDRGDVVGDAAVRILKAKLAVVMEEREVEQAELKEVKAKWKSLHSETKDKSKDLDKYTKEAAAMKREARLAQKKATELAAALETEKQRSRDLQLQLDAIKKETTKESSGKHSLEVRLNRAVEEKDALKLQLQKLKSRPSTASGGKDIQVLQNKIRQLTAQRDEALAAFEKALKLVDILKRQKVHLEAARVLSFTEDEFVKALDWGGEV